MNGHFPPMAASARSRYSCEPIEAPWGVSTRPMTRATPAPVNAAAPSSIRGAVCLAP